MTREALLTRTRRDEASGCVLWTGHVTTDGYGSLVVDGVRWSTHRYAWFLTNGPIPRGSVVMHSCDTRRCVNDEHLSVGTSRENTRDAIAKGRLSCGSRHPNAVLDEARARQIIVERKSGALLRELSVKYGVNVSTIHNICAGKRWAHVQKENL